MNGKYLVRRKSNFAIVQRAGQTVSTSSGNVRK